jgi:HKD family nuclease
MKVARSFNGRWTSFFATTYSIELEFFDEYLFRRLGDPPLSATILADASSHARLWTTGGDALRRLRRANRDYLLRPVLLGSGTFHPKTYFLGNANEGILLVGSGNLTLSGIERGRELFARFESRETADLGSIRTWRQWMEGIVERLGDPEVTYRWLRLRGECSEWLEGEPDGSLFVANSQRSMLDQLADAVEPPVDELHVMAPFYDRDARALSALIGRFEPRQLRLYLAAHTSVHGPSLVSVVSDSSQATVYEVDPLEFVHAKLVGVITGDRGRLLLGSANLSRAALLGTNERWANVEAGVIVELPSDEMRQAFLPPGSRWKDAALDQIASLSFTAEERPLGFPAHLKSAWPEPDGRVKVELSGTVPADAELTAGGEGQRLESMTTVAPLAVPEGGVLIWLRSTDASDLSNKVPLDDRRRLGSWLEQRSEAGARPRELDSSDFETPVGQLLLRLHEACIFDIDETPAMARAAGLTDQEASEEQTATWEELEELLAKEELARDPRVEHYRHSTPFGLPADDDVFGLLRLMLDRTPAEAHLRLVGGKQEEPQGPEPQPGSRWTPTQRLRVRLFNVLQRWSHALADPRFAWIDPTAPVRNYAALLVADAECWEQEHLPPERIIRLLGSLFGSFLRTERSPGYLLSLSEDDRRHALARLNSEARALGAALVYCALRPGANWRDHVFEWQPALIEGHQLGIFAVTAEACDVVQRLTGQPATEAEIGDRLQWVTTYIDDEHWAAKQERELGFERVRLTKRNFDRSFGITLEVSGDRVSLEEPQLVSLVRQALAYRKTDGAILELGDQARLSVKLGDPIWARVGEQTFCTPGNVYLDDLADLERQGVSFARALEPAEQAAS